MLDVKVKIDLTKPAGKLSFGYPLVLSIGTAKDYVECASLAEVVTAGFEATTNVYKAAALMFGQNNPPAKIAVCGLAEAAGISTILEKPWRQLVVVDAEDISAIATAIAATPDKVLFATVADATKGKALTKSDKVVGFVHTDALASAALVGEAAGREIGSFTYKNLILNGIEPMDYTDAEIQAIHEANCITFVTKAGDNVTTEGIATSGEYIDIVDCQDYVIQQLEYQTQKTLNNMGKIPYDNNGIAILESVAVNVMRDAYNKGMIATNEDGTPAYSVNYLKREETDPADRAERKYLGGQFRFTLAGAIHTVEVTGEILI